MDSCTSEPHVAECAVLVFGFGMMNAVLLFETETLPAFNGDQHPERLA